MSSGMGETFPSIDFYKIHMLRRDRVKLVSIEGGIGSGKSTIAGIIENLVTDIEANNGEKVYIVTEPVDEWINSKIKYEDGKELSILDEYYMDPKKRAFGFQINALMTRMKRMMNKLTDIVNSLPDDDSKVIIIVERSPLSDRHCFAQINYEVGNIDEREMTIYLELYNFVMNTFRLLIPDYILYLRVPPEECEKRIAFRQRTAESGISFDYLQKLHSRHETWLTDDSLNIPVMQIDGMLSFHKDTDVMHTIYNDINKFIKAS